MALGKKSLVFSMVMILGALLISEVALQVLSLVFPRVGLILSPMSAVLKDGRLGRRPGPRHPDHDRKGFRNAGVLDEVSVVAIGDSQTYGYTVPRDEAWPQRVESLSKIKTYNMAFGQYGPAHSLLLLDEAMGLKPKLIIEAFYTGNDLYDSYSLIYDRNQLSYLKSHDESVLKAIVDAERREPLRAKISRLFSGTHGIEIRDEGGAPMFREFLADHFKLYGALRAAKYMYINNKQPRMREDVKWQSLKQTAMMRSEYLQVFENGRNRTILTPNLRLFAVDLKDPRIVEGLRISLEAMRLMRDRSREANTAFAVLLIPTKEMAFRDAVYENGLKIPETYKSLIENEQRVLQKTKDFLSSHQIYFLDALPGLRESVRHDNQPYNMSTDGHLNSTGHRIVAELVLAGIRKHGLLAQTNSK